VKLACATLLAAVVIGAAASSAGANGDPASDVLPFTTVYLSTQDPKTSSAGRDLLAVTTAAAKKRQPIRVAVIATKGDLGLIQSLWLKPQAYAEFLGKELFQFAHYSGTLLVAMPNGYGIYGPQSGKAKASLAKLSKPGTSDLDELGDDAAGAVRAVATANGYTVPAGASGSGTPAWAIVLAALGGAALVAAVAFLVLRRWLLRP
jgi:hypothetical protein